MTDRQIKLIESIKSSLEQNNINYKNYEYINKNVKTYHFENDSEITITIDVSDLNDKYIITELDKVQIFDEDLLVKIEGLVFADSRGRYLSLRISGDFSITIKNILKDVYVRL